MCGRYALTTSPQMLADLLGIHRLRSSLVPRYNIAPTQLVPAVRSDAEGGRELVDLHWGLIPPWAKDRTIASRMINARSESVDEKPAFRKAFRDRRCVVPADGFYEWKKQGRSKQPYFVRRADGSPMFIAGLWEKWTDRGTGELVESCTILTTEPNEKVAELHNRMPVVLDGGGVDRWLSRGRPEAELKALLRAAPSEWFVMDAVSTQVNSPANEGPALVEPIGDQSPAAGDAQPGLFD
jgi:putative SOS response-associated peptidase YedK